MSVHSCLVRFRMINWVNINGISPNLVCSLILWKSSLELQMGKFIRFWHNYLPVTHLYFCFQTITWVNVCGFSPNLVYALISWKSALGLLMDIFRQFFTVLSACNRSVFLFQDNKLSGSQWLFKKRSWYVHWYCGNLVGIANGQILSISDIFICPWQDSGRVLLFHVYIYAIRCNCKNWNYHTYPKYSNRQAWAKKCKMK